MSQKSDLITAIQFTYDEILAFAGSLSEEERSTPGLVDRWTNHDVLAHLAYSNRQMVETLSAGRRGEAPSAGLSNEEAYYAYKDQPWDNILAEFRQANQLLLEQVHELNEEELNNPVEWSNGRAIWRAIAGSAILHPIIHLAQAYIERGEGEQAMRLDERVNAIAGHLDDSPDWKGLFLYNTGCYYALLRDTRSALENLESSFRMSSRMVEYSKQDPDLVSLQGDPDYLALLKRF